MWVKRKHIDWSTMSIFDNKLQIEGKQDSQYPTKTDFRLAH